MNEAERNETLLERVERATELPMLVLALLYLAVFVTGYLDVPPTIHEIAGFAEYLIIAAFAAELIVKVMVAERKLAYLRSHWLDVLIVVLPFLRPLRLLRLLRVALLLALVLRSVHGFRLVMGRYKGAYVLSVALVSVLASAALMAVFEARAPGSSIHDFGDALWWAVATVTTVGYGDVTPHTPEGRAVAVFLMLVGITLFGMITAGLAAYFVKGTEADGQDAAIRELSGQVRLLRSELADLRRVLDEGAGEGMIERRHQ